MQRQQHMPFEVIGCGCFMASFVSLGKRGLPQNHNVCSCMVIACVFVYVPLQNGEEPTAQQEQLAQQPLLAEPPDPCLVAVLRCCAANDQRSLFSAARAHSRLHKAAVAALSRIALTCSNQQQADGVLAYLGKHGCHVDSVKILGDKLCAFDLRQLPPGLQLSSLQLGWCCLQLRPGDGFTSVLGAPAGISALKQLDLSECHLLDRNADNALAAPLLQLSGLEQLSLCGLRLRGGLSTAVLQRMQQLTYLSLQRVGMQGPDETTPLLQPLQALTRLVDLRLDFAEARHTESISVPACYCRSHS